MQDEEDLFGMFKLAFTFRKQKSPTLQIIAFKKISDVSECLKVTLVVRNMAHPEVIKVKSPSFRKGQIMQNVPVYSSFRDLTDYSNLKNQL